MEPKKVSVISFTEKGMKLSEELKIRAKEHICTSLYTKWNGYGGERKQISALEGSLSDWTKSRFLHKEAVIFIGACGIAVRTIAPFIKDKLQDIPVLVVDEAGSFVIPVLSGHFGGANELAEIIAERMEMTAVITTATDVNGVFAADVFARKNRLAICNREGIKEISAAVLGGEKTGIAIDGEYEGDIPEELVFISPEETSFHGSSILISPYKRKGVRADLYLAPKAFFLGIGCRKGKSAEEIEAAVRRRLEQAEIRMEAVAGLATIDIKKEEEGLILLSQKYGWELRIFSKEELERVPGNYNASPFVKSQVGVDNVCERAAAAACGGYGTLICGKQAGNGITVAIAMKKWSVSFYEI